MIHTVQFVAILLASLSMSVHFGTWLVEVPMRETSSGALFIEVHKGRDRVASRVMPVLGNVAILAVGACVFLMRNEPEAFALSLAGLLLFLASMAVTLGGNVPINKQVQSWDTTAPPSHWSQLRDRWEKLHSLRTALIVSGFALFASSVVFFKV
jgi:hypothetical protein